MSKIPQIISNLEKQLNFLKKNVEENPVDINSEYIIKMHALLQELLDLTLSGDNIDIRKHNSIEKESIREEENGKLDIDVSLNVLFIDDNENVLDMIKEFFANKNINDYYLNSAVGLKEFLLKHPEIEIIVSDIRMPYFTGIDVLNIIKSDSNFAHIKVLLMSAYRDFENLVSGIEQGAFAFIFKPIKFEELIDQLLKAKNAIKFHREGKNDLQDSKKYNYNSFNLFVDSKLNIITISKYYPLKYHKVLENAKRVCDIFKCKVDCEKCDGSDCNICVFKRLINEAKYNMYGFTESSISVFSKVFNDILYLKVKCRVYDDRSTKFFFTIDDETQERKHQIESFTDERLNAVKRIAGGLAHEINQPLNSISAKIQTHLFDLSDRLEICYDEYIEDYKFMLMEVNKISTLLQNMRILGGKYKNIYFKEINILPILHKVLNQFKVELKYLNIEVSIDASSDYILLRSNETHLFQIFFNLLSNSLDSIEEKRSFLAKDFKGEISIVIDEQPDIINILFKDNGIGIKEENKFKIFDPFFTTKDVNKGSGLGLYIIYDIIINNYGGKISVDSVYKEYVEFNIKFPKR